METVTLLYYTIHSKNPLSKIIEVRLDELTVSFEDLIRNNYEKRGNFGRWSPKSVELINDLILKERLKNFTQ